MATTFKLVLHKFEDKFGGNLNVCYIGKRNFSVPSILNSFFFYQTDHEHRRVKRWPKVSDYGLFSRNGSDSILATNVVLNVYKTLT